MYLLWFTRANGMRLWALLNAGTWNSFYNKHHTLMVIIQVGKMYSNQSKVLTGLDWFLPMRWPSIPERLLVVLTQNWMCTTNRGSVIKGRWVGKNQSSPVRAFHYKGDRKTWLSPFLESQNCFRAENFANFCSILNELPLREDIKISQCFNFWGLILRAFYHGTAQVVFVPVVTYRVLTHQ